MPAKLPEKYNKKKPRYLSEVAVGETVHVNFTAMVVDEEGSCFLDPDAKLSDEVLLTIDVMRAEDGYHVTIGPRFKWELRARETKGLFPVATIEENPDMWPSAKKGSAK